MTKKTTSSKTCLACGKRLHRAQSKYAKQYCDEHKNDGPTATDATALSNG